MEFLYGQLRKLEVISVTDGKNLGKICDVAMFLPEGRIKGFFITGGRGFHFTKSDVFVPLTDVIKIGEDAILVNTGKGGNPPPSPPQNRVCPPSYTGKGDGCADSGGRRSGGRSGGRNFDEYE